MSNPPSARKRSKESKKQRIARGFVLSLTLIYFLLLGGVSLCNFLGPERWWVSGLNMYLPQWPWAIPGGCLTLISLIFCRKLAWLPPISFLWVGGSIMGFCWGSAEIPDPGNKAVPLRIMTYNVKWGQQSSPDIAAEIVRESPDILLMQDSGSIMRGVVGTVLRGYHVEGFGQFTVASKFPLDKLTIGYVPYQGQTHTYVTTRIHIKGITLNLANVHLVTPRYGLLAMRYEREDGVGDLERNINSRLSQTDKLVKDISNLDGPLIVAGDLNAPIQSEVCKRLMNAGLRDAFSVAGRGYGYTYGHHVRRLKYSYLRIDHILVNDAVRVKNCWTGGSQGSDHRPVIAELFLSGARISSK